MKVRVYAVQDKLAGRFGQPFCLASDEMAQRHFRQMMAGIVQYETYSLYCIGVYDDETGVIEPDVRALVMYALGDEPNSKQAADSPTAPECTKEFTEDDAARSASLAAALSNAIDKWRK